jgi:hypothetical protein
MNRRSIRLLSAVLLFSSGIIAARALEESNQGRKPTHKAAQEVAKMSGGHSKEEAKKQPAPCPRGTWKDDPVCFGEGAQDALPLPSSSAVEHATVSQDPSIRPTANLNSRPASPGPYQAGVVYQSNGNSVTNNYGGGVSLQLPF